MRIERHPILTFGGGREVEFTFEGRQLTGREGEPIAAALHAAGIQVLSYTPENHRARGIFCAIGNCSSCLMEVDGRPNVRTCTEKLREGMAVRRQDGRGRLGGERP